MAISPKRKKPRSVADADGKQAAAEQAALTSRRKSRNHLAAAAKAPLPLWDFSEFDEDSLWQEIFGGPLPPLTDTEDEDEDEEMPLATPTKASPPATGSTEKKRKRKVRSPQSQAARRPAKPLNNAAGPSDSVLKTPKKKSRHPQRPPSGTTSSPPGNAKKRVRFGPSGTGPSSEARLPPMIENDFFKLEREMRKTRVREMEILSNNTSEINKAAGLVLSIMEAREGSMERILGPPAQSPVRFGSTDTEICDKH